MDLLIRPSPLNMVSNLTEIDTLLSGTTLSFALFLTNERMVVANTLFIRQWDLHRVSFPLLSLSDFRNKNALLMSGETKGRYLSWSGESSPYPSAITLPDPHSDGERILLKVPTDQESAGDPFFLELGGLTTTEEEKEGLILLGRRLRTPARAIARSFRDDILLKRFFAEQIGPDPFATDAEILLSKEPQWSPDSPVWRIRRPDKGPMVAASLPGEETGSLHPFRRMVYSKIPGRGYWVDFPLLYDGSFFGQVRLFRPESAKAALGKLNGFQRQAQKLSRELFTVRKNSGELAPIEREPDTGFLTRKGAIQLLEALIGEYRVSRNGFGLIGIRIDLPNHRELMVKLPKIIRHYDAVGHLTPREYLLVLPAMKPEAFPTIVARARDMLLGLHQDLAHFISFGTVSYPASMKGPINLLRSAFVREEAPEDWSTPPSRTDVPGPN